MPLVAYAVDGCKVLLCLAAPDWRQIPQCVPTIRELLRDLRRGRVFPRCAMAGAGNGAELHAAGAPGACPPQYSSQESGDTGYYWVCQYSNVITIRLNDQPWSNVWWNMGGDSVTEYLPQAKSQLGSWNTRFDADYQAWLESQPPASPPPAESNGG